MIHQSIQAGTWCWRIGVIPEKSKQGMESIFYVYFKNDSFILHILEVQEVYALNELPKKKYK